MILDKRAERLLRKKLWLTLVELLSRTTVLGKLTVADPGLVTLWDDNRCLDKRAERLLDYGFRSSTQFPLKRKFY